MAQQHSPPEDLPSKDPSCEDSPPKDPPRNDSLQPELPSKDSLTPEECFRYFDSIHDRLIDQNKQVRDAYASMRQSSASINRTAERTHRATLDAVNAPTVDEEAFCVATRFQAVRDKFLEMVQYGIECMSVYREEPALRPWTLMEKGLFSQISEQLVMMMRIAGMKPPNAEFSEIARELATHKQGILASMPEEMRSGK